MIIYANNWLQYRYQPKYSLNIAVYVSISIGKFTFLVSQIFDDITQLAS